MNLKLKNYLSKVSLIAMLSGTMFFCGGSVNAARVSDTNSPLEYVCFRGAITAWLRGTKVEDWKSATMKSSERQTTFKFTRKGWIGRIELPNDMALFPEKISLKISNLVDTTDPHKELTLDNMIIEGRDEEISSMSFCCNYEGGFLDVKFSYLNRMVQLFSKTRGCVKIFKLEDDEYSLKQVFSLGISIIMDYILN